MVELLQNVISGCNTSAILLISALGLVIIFGLMGVLNMAHGELMMVGAYITFFITKVNQGPFLLALLLSFLITGIFGAFIEVTIVKRLYAKPTETLLATYGVSLILERLVYLIFGAETKNVPMPIPGLLQMGEVTIAYYNIFIIVVSILLLLITFFIFQKTKFGKKMRATTQNRDMTECLGIETSRVDTWTFAYGAGLSGLAGAMVAPIISVTPSLGASYLTDSFMTVVIGGVQSIFGTALGSVMIGEARTILSGLTSSVTAKILVFLIVIVIIRFKPQGLFTKERR